MINDEYRGPQTLTQLPATGIAEIEELKKQYEPLEAEEAEIKRRLRELEDQTAMVRSAAGAGALDYAAPDSEAAKLKDDVVAASRRLGEITLAKSDIRERLHALVEERREEWLSDDLATKRERELAKYAKAFEAFLEAMRRVDELAAVAAWVAEFPSQAFSARPLNLRLAAHRHTREPTYTSEVLDALRDYGKPRPSRDLRLGVPAGVANQDEAE